MMSFGNGVRLRIAALVVAATAIGLAGPAVASAAPSVPSSPLASSSSVAQYSDSQLETAAANIAAQFDQIRNRLTPELQNKPLNSPEVQQALNNNGAVHPNFNIFTCSIAVGKAALEIGVPVAKIYRIAKEFGGTASFIKIVFQFIRTGSFPANATDEAVDLILALSGVGGIISSCL